LADLPAGWWKRASVAIDGAAFEPKLAGSGENGLTVVTLARVP
jgi:hypothetical protein